MTFEEWYDKTVAKDISDTIKDSDVYKIMKKCYECGYTEGQWALCKELGYREDS